jgi:GNAT superfamily N-acetyltransferase
MTPANIPLPPSPIAGLQAIELDGRSVPLLQAFFDANPEYFLAVQGTPAAPNEADEEIHGAPPVEWGFTRKWVIGYVDASGDLIALANLVSDLLAPGVWNLSTFILATARHGTGDAQRIYNSLQDWAGAHGAAWLRLGVVQGNARGERFWESVGYVQTRLRNGVPFGDQIRTLRVMVKPLRGGTANEYLALVARDRPDPDDPAQPASTPAQGPDGAT